MERSKSGDDAIGAGAVRRGLFLTASRSGLAVGMVAATALLTYALVRAGVVYVGAGSTLPTLLGSGTMSGLLTLITVALSVNQLVLSRVFGSPSSLTDRFDGTLDFREQVEDAAGVSKSPIDPGTFLALVGETLEQRAADLERRLAGTDLEAEFEEFTRRLVEFGDHLASADERDSTMDVLLVTFGTTYAACVAEARSLRRRHGDELSEETDGDLADVFELLRAVAVSRQFFKTLAVQQDLAALSRRLIYTGLGAVLTTFYLTQVYTDASSLPTTLPPAWMPLVASVAAGVVLSPLFVLLSHLLRVTTVAMYTVSVGPFVPPEERTDE